jgi:hypothetical protein
MGGIIAAPARPNNRAAAREVHEALQTIVAERKKLGKAWRGGPAHVAGIDG